MIGKGLWKHEDWWHSLKYQGVNCYYSTRNVYLVFPDVQQQIDGSSCGLYALAFAHTFCKGGDFSRVMYSQDSLCSHSETCLCDKISLLGSGPALYEPGPFLKSRIRFFACVDCQILVMAFNLELDLLVDEAVLVVNYQTDTLPTDFFVFIQLDLIPCLHRESTARLDMAWHGSGPHLHRSMTTL